MGFCNKRVKEHHSTIDNKDNGEKRLCYTEEIKHRQNTTIINKATANSEPLNVQVFFFLNILLGVGKKKICSLLT